MENAIITLNIDPPPDEEKNDVVEEEPKVNEGKSVHFDTLVLSGGSTNSIMTLGALQHLYDDSLHLEITTYIGTSSGAIIGYLLAIGYTPLEIMLEICTKRVLERLQFFNIYDMINGVGACSFSVVQEFLEKMTINKIGTLVTLKDLYEKYKRVLICATYNLTKGICEYLSHENYPNLPCLTALRMTSNLPLIFEPYKYEQSFYIDGAVSDNFPIDLGDKLGKKVLGILLGSTSHKMEPSMPIVEYIYKLIFIPINDNTRRRIDGVSDKCKVIRITIQDMSFLKFNMTTPTMLNMFSFGYKHLDDL